MDILQLSVIFMFIWSKNLPYVIFSRLFSQIFKILEKLQTAVNMQQPKQYSKK